MICNAYLTTDFRSNSPIHSYRRRIKIRNAKMCEFKFLSMATVMGHSVYCHFSIYIIKVFSSFLADKKILID